MSETTKLRVGFVGLGAMGGRMALRLLEAGYPLTVYNRTPQRAEELKKRGAAVAGSPKELAAGTDLVISMVADDAALGQVMFGRAGVMEGIGDGKTVMDMSTVSLEAAMRLHAAAKEKGAASLDAPVSGSTPQAERGELVIFAGGEEQVFQRCRPVLEVMGKKVLHMGPAGSGVKMKLCVNLMLGLGIQAVAESVALGVKAGLDLGQVLSGLGETVVVSVSQKSKFENVKKGEYPPAFPLRLMHKDLGLILQQAQATNVPVPATAAAAQWFAAEHARQARDQTKDPDMSAIVQTMLDAACAT